MDSQNSHCTPEEMRENIRRIFTGEPLGRHIADQEGFTYEQNPIEALRIMLRMAGYADNEIDDQLLARARAFCDGVPVESLEWSDEIPG